MSTVPEWSSLSGPPSVPLRVYTMFGESSLSRATLSTSPTPTPTHTNVTPAARRSLDGKVLPIPRCSNHSKPSASTNLCEKAEFALNQVILLMTGLLRRQRVGPRAGDPVGLANHWGRREIRAKARWPMTPNACRLPDHGRTDYFYELSTASGCASFSHEHDEQDGTASLKNTHSRREAWPTAEWAVTFARRERSFSTPLCSFKLRSSLCWTLLSIRT